MRHSRFTMITPGLILPLLLTLAFFLGACSADRQDPADNGLTVHPGTWMDHESSDFHGHLVARDTPQTCRNCHGEDLEGAGKAPDCWECHDGPGGHPEGWISPIEPFHGDTVALEGDQECAECHGEDFRGGWAEVSCYTCHDGPSGHPVNWLKPSSPSFHAKKVAAEGTSECAVCHGADFQGGWSGVSCYTCHNGPSGHPVGWVVPGTDNFHGDEVEAEGDTRCQACHGADLGGGTSGVSCSKCHSYPISAPRR